MVWDPHTTETALQLDMVHHQAAMRMKNDGLSPVEFSHSAAQRRPALVGAGLELNRCLTLLPDVEDSPLPHLDRSNKTCHSTKTPHPPTTDAGKQEVL